MLAQIYYNFGIYRNALYAFPKVEFCQFLNFPYITAYSFDIYPIFSSSNVKTFKTRIRMIEIVSLKEKCIYNVYIFEPSRDTIEALKRWNKTDLRFTVFIMDLTWLIEHRFQTYNHRYLRLYL